MNRTKGHCKFDENPFIHQAVLRLVSQGDAQMDSTILCDCVILFSMKKIASTGHRRNFDYPATTKGGQVAARVRASANHLSESERESLFKKGMQMIYGGTKETVGR